MDEPCATVILVLLLCLCGGQVCRGRERARAWGMRLGVGAFLAYGALLVWHERPNGSGECLFVAIRSLIVSVLVVGLSWIMLPAAGFVVHHGVIRPWRGFWGACQCLWRPLTRWRERRQEKQRKTDYDRKLREWRAEEERNRPAVEAQERDKMKMQRLREDARARVELAYSLLAPEIGQRFPRELFTDFCKRYLGDDRHPEDVEHRAQELLELIQGHAGRVTRPSEKKTLSQLMQEFETQQREIEASNLDTRMKQTLLLSLREKMLDQLTRQAAESA